MRNCNPTHKKRVARNPGNSSKYERFSDYAIYHIATTTIPNNMHPSPNHIIRRDMGPASFHSPIKRPERFPVRTARDCIRAQPTDVPASPRKWPPIPYIIMLMYHNTPATTANIQFFQLPLRYNFLVPRVYSKYKQYPTFTIHPAVNAIHQTTFVAYMGSAPAITACSCIGVPYTTATLIIGLKIPAARPNIQPFKNDRSVAILLLFPEA